MSASRPQDSGPTINPAASQISLAAFKSLAFRSLAAGTALACLAGVLMFAASFLLDDEYQSSVRLLPPALYSAPSRIGIFNSDSLTERMSDQLSVRYQSDIAITVLKGSTVVDAVVKQEELAKHYGTTSARNARDKLLEATRVSAGRDGVVVIQVSDRSSSKAAGIANAYLSSLERYVIDVINSSAKARADAIRMQLTLAQQRQKEIDAYFVDVQNRTGIVKLAGDSASAASANLNDLRQRLAVRQAQIQAMSVYATTSNPAYTRIQAEAAGLRAQIVAIAGSVSDSGGTSEREIKYQRALRDVRSSEEAVDGLRKQLVQAEFEAMSKLAGLQVLERASPNELRSGPRRLLMAAITALTVLLLVLLWFLWRVRRHRLGMLDSKGADTFQAA